MALALLFFFTSFNVLEATLPSMISKLAPLDSKGTAMGVYSSVQFFGAFFGASIGGFIMQNFGGNAVFGFAISLLLLWLWVASKMQTPAAVRTILYHLPELDEAKASSLLRRLTYVKGVREVMLKAEEGMVCIKVDMLEFDEAAVEQLIMFPVCD